MFRFASPVGVARSTVSSSRPRYSFISVYRRGPDRATTPPAGDRHRAGTEPCRRRPTATQCGAIRAPVRQVREPATAGPTSDQGQGRSRRAGCHERAAGADRNQQDPGRRRDRPGRRLQKFDRRQHHQGHPGLCAGRLRAAEMGRRHPTVNPRLRPVAQFPSARRAALHGRHSDQHRRRLRRSSRRSIRPPTNMSRSTRAPTRCNSVRTRWAVFEAATVDDLGEIEQRAGEAGARDAVDGLDVARRRPLAWCATMPFTPRPRRPGDVTSLTARLSGRRPRSAAADR